MSRAISKGEAVESRPGDAVVLTKWETTSGKGDIALHLEGARVLSDGRVQQVVTSILVPADHCEQLAADIRAAAVKAAR